VGVLLLGLIGNGFNLSNIDPVYQGIVYGGVILIAAGVDALLRRRRA
jgi:ribose/xylose/arabinose/galactoside ABC-type transport system permease subunit